MRPLRLSSRPTASKVPRNRGSSGAQQARVRRASSTLASRSWPSRAPASAPLSSFQARERIGSRKFVRMGAPIGGAIRDAEPRRDLRQTVARRPAERGRMRVDALAPAIFPYAGVRRQRELQRPFAERLERLEQRRVAHARQALVDEHLRRRENDAAIDVVLALHHGEIADANRSVALESPRDRARSLRSAGRRARSNEPASAARRDRRRRSGYN